MMGVGFVVTLFDDCEKDEAQSPNYSRIPSDAIIMLWMIVIIF